MRSACLQLPTCMWTIELHIHSALVPRCGSHRSALLLHDEVDVPQVSTTLRHEIFRTQNYRLARIYYCLDTVHLGCGSDHCCEAILVWASLISLTANKL